jgi:Uncharacterized protein conserved in bacteria (DUF2188)
MKRMEVVKTKDGQWRGQSSGRALPGTSSPRKVDAVKKTAQKARSSKEPVSLKIKKENGRVQEERTYPRKADPRRSRG